MTKTATKVTLTNSQKRDWAKLLYMKEHIPLQEIAKRVGVNRITVGRWAEKENWEMLRAAVTSTREEQIRNMYVQIAQINDAISKSETKYATPAQADTINKLSAAIAKMEGDFGIADIISVSKRILTWMRGRDPEKAIEMASEFDEFIKTQLR